jgi:hypothetical protein
MRKVQQSDELNPNSYLVQFQLKAARIIYKLQQRWDAAEWELLEKEALELAKYSGSLAIMEQTKNE